MLPYSAGAIGWTCSICGAFVAASQTHDCQSTSSGSPVISYTVNGYPSLQMAEDMRTVIRLLKGIEFLLRTRLRG